MMTYTDFRARVASDTGTTAFECGGELTPYALETVSEHAVRAGPGASIEMDVAAETDDTAIAWVKDRFARLHKRGVRALVRRARRSDFVTGGSLRRTLC